MGCRGRPNVASPGCRSGAPAHGPRRRAPAGGRAGWSHRSWVAPASDVIGAAREHLAAHGAESAPGASHAARTAACAVRNTITRTHDVRSVTDVVGAAGGDATSTGGCAAVDRLAPLCTCRCTPGAGRRRGLGGAALGDRRPAWTALATLVHPGVIGLAGDGGGAWGRGGAMEVVQDHAVTGPAHGQQRLGRERGLASLARAQAEKPDGLRGRHDGCRARMNRRWRRPAPAHLPPPGPHVAAEPKELCGVSRAQCQGRRVRLVSKSWPRPPAWLRHVVRGPAWRELAGREGARTLQKASARPCAQEGSWPSFESEGLEGRTPPCMRHQRRVLAARAGLRLCALVPCQACVRWMRHTHGAGAPAVRSLHSAAELLAAGQVVDAWCAALTTCAGCSSAVRTSECLTPGK